jgi:sugar lactone lactonase YvrE
MTATVFDDTPCTLGEGPLWHPGREQLFWFDITGRRLLAHGTDGGRHWSFPEQVSAAGWLDDDRLLIASESALFSFDLANGAREDVVPLEAESPGTRSNDGRADPWGGFWIGTMSKAAEREAGAIYRYYRGELRQLFAPLTIPNAICFTPDRRFAHFADTPTRRILRVALDATDGWPSGTPEVFVDLRDEGLNPDGAVVDAGGTLWNAQWGAGRVAAYGPDGRFLRALPLPARHSTCPAFGGPELGTLFCTSAREGIGAEEIAAEPRHGMTFALGPAGPGQPEHRVIL